MILNKKRKLISIGMLLLAATSCNAPSSGDSDNVTYVVVTSAPEVIGVSDVQQGTEAPPAATLIPPTPTPFIDPNVALQIADRYFLNGYYENAVFSYQQLLAREDASPQVQAAAAYSMGQAALREGLFQNAVDALTRLIQNFPSDYRAVQGYFLRGDAYMGLSQWQLAINDYQQYLTLRPGLIDSYAYERIGDAQLALEQYETAFASYTQAANTNRTLTPLLALREKIARLHLLSGQVDQAVSQYDAILAVAENEAYRAGIEFRAAQALLDAGNTQVGFPRMNHVFETYETRTEAYDAMNLLLQNGWTLDAYQRGRVNYFHGEYQAAIEAFNVYTTEVPVSNIPAELHLLLGRAYREVGNSAAALVAFQTIIAQYPTDPMFGEAVLEQGRTRFLNNEIDAAISQYLQAGENYAYLPAVAAEALWRAGFLYSTNGNQQEAQKVFVRLADTFPNSEQAISGLLIAASAALTSGNTVNAETLYARIAATATGEQKAEAYLQVGRLALQRGDAQTANAAFAEAAAAGPDTYYGVRAQDLMVGRAPFTPPVRYVFEFDDVVEVTEAENWIRSTFGVVQEGPLWPLSPQLEVEPRIVRGRELWAVGAFDAAETEFLDVLEDYEGDGLASYQMSIMLRILGSYYPSQQGAANVITAAGLSTLQAPAYIARMRYPAFYRDIVLEVGQRRNLDPLLIFSLIRHESLFDTNATAAAGEKGLTQVIPGTADYIAEQIAFPDYQHSDLFRPYAGIEFGAFYLEENLARFDGNVYAGLGAYNAGPGRSIQWMEISGGDPDLYMSAITIDSTKLYIQLIYRNYAIYRELYGEDV